MNEGQNAKKRYPVLRVITPRPTLAALATPSYGPLQIEQETYSITGNSPVPAHGFPRNPYHDDSSQALAGNGRILGAAGTDMDELLKLTQHGLGYEAFKPGRYTLLGGVETGARGLTGIVRSQAWRSSFAFVSDLAEDLEAPLLFIVFAANLLQKAPEFSTVARSGQSSWEKANAYAGITRKAAVETVAGLITGNVDLVFHAIRGYCEIGDLAGRQLGSERTQSVSNACRDNLEKWNGKLDTFVSSAADPVVSGAVWWMAGVPNASPLVSITIKLLKKPGGAK